MKIAVLAGGTSTERDVSLQSGKVIYEALKSKGHRVVLIDVYLGYDKEDYPDVFEQEKDWGSRIGKIQEKVPDVEQIKTARADGGLSFFGPRVLDICRQADIVFMGLHGAPGEDGKVQAALDLQGIKYTGTGSFGAALAMDKGIAKQLFAHNGIPTPLGITIKKGAAAAHGIPYPVVVKTCCGGSSVGVYIAENETEYREALTNAFGYEEEVVVEQYVKGREFSVGVVEGKALPIIEMAPLVGFFDYKNKYQAGNTIETCPADLPPDITAKMQKTAEDVFRVLHLETYARMDFVMQEDGQYFCLEGNTLPGMTAGSLLPQEALAAGITYPDFCEKIIEISLKKYNEQ